ncbi:glycosyltransferase family 2 protein [Salinibacter ruber]|uniref:glycosyltransferase family 2 protein n=1 Tax=Salinibacter ruber TaxID=146919 RepID=UPI002072F921|nr:glycosyltransferase family A protein [Salinibacter ruber]
MAPLVSILIPCHNAERWLVQTLESALGQTWPNTEIIVVDDGSADDSLEIARSFEPRGVTVLAQENQGACAARNRALEEAKGAFIQFLDADDLLTPDKIELQMRRLRDEPEGTIAAAPWKRFYETPGDYESTSKSHESWHDFEDPLNWLLQSARGETMMPLHGWLVSRSLIEKAGCWNEDLLLNQDGEYFARVLLEAHQIVFCPGPTVYYRTTEEGISTRNSRVKWKSFLRSWNLIYNHIAGERDGPEVRCSLASLYKRTAFRVYPKYPKISKTAKKRAEDLCDVEWEFPDTSFLMRLTIRTLGWRRARQIQVNYRKFVYG